MNNVSKKFERNVIFMIFLIILISKLYFVFQTPYLNQDAYFEERQISSILETGFPISWDELSYSGRSYISNPIYYYVLSIFASILGTTLTLKILPNLFIALLSIIIYLIVKKITQQKLPAFLSSLAVGFIPGLSKLTLLTGSAHSLTFLLMFLALYFFIDLRFKKNIYYFLIIIMLLPFIHPISSLLIAGLMFYFILMKIDGFNLNKYEIETVVFSIFYFVLTLFFQYKEALIKNGAAIIWQNIPLQILNQYFTGVNILTYVATIGIIPLIIGTYVIYKYSFEINKSSIHIFIGLALATFIILWLKFIEPQVGLSIIAICLVILMGEGLNLLIKELKHTKFVSLKFLILSILFILVIFTSVLDNINIQNIEIDNVPKKDLISALHWIKDNTPQNSVVLGTLEQGHLITSIAMRKNVFDKNFILIDNPGTIVEDVNKVYNSNSLISNIKLLNLYQVNYIIIDSEKMPEIIKDNNCFKLEYDSDEYLVYESLCKVEKIG